MTGPAVNEWPISGAIITLEPGRRLDHLLPGRDRAFLYVLAGVPVFFVSSGCEFDLGALMHSPSAAARIPLFLLVLLLVRGAPAALYVRTVGRRGAVAAGFLQATSLPVIVTAASIGVAIGVVAPVTAAALVAAGLLSVLVFPLAALTLVRGDRSQRAIQAR
jgi:Kef-type K+ transport system membrane component KefB